MKYHSTIPGNSTGPANSNDDSEDPPPLISQYGPGPELELNDDLRMHPLTTTNLLHSQSAYSTDCIPTNATTTTTNNNNNNSNNNKLVARTFEPDNGDCAQPDQRRRSYDDVLALLETNTGSARTVFQDASTIYTARTGTDTLETEATLQRGSLSKKPSPDDPGLKPCNTKRLSFSPLPDPPRHRVKEINIPNSIPSSLSFPSPPSRQDVEWPTRDTASGNTSTSLRDDEEHHEYPAGEGNVYNTTTCSDNNNHSNPTQEGTSSNALKNISVKSQLPGSKKKNKWMLLAIAALVLVVVLATVLGISVPQDKEADSAPQGVVEEQPIVPPIPETILPSVAPSDVAAGSVVPTGSIIPSMSPTTNDDMDLDIVSNSDSVPATDHTVHGNKTFGNTSTTMYLVGIVSPSNTTTLNANNFTYEAFSTLVGNITSTSTSNVTIQAPSDSQSLRGKRGVLGV